MRDKYLTKGAVWGIVVTGSPLSSERLDSGISTLKDMGFSVRCPIDPSAYYGNYEHGFSNGSVKERVSAIETLLRDPEVEVLLASRGGYGAMEILPHLDFSLFKDYPKPLVGCSDTTMLLTQPGVLGIHGSVLGSDFADYSSKPEARRSVDALISLLCREGNIEYQCQPLREGNARGRLLVGNLSVLVSLLGTPWDLDYSGCILVLEEVGESPYRVDRSLRQLKLAGKLDKLVGLVFGRFARCESANGPSVQDVILRGLDDILPFYSSGGGSFPVYTGLEVGHWGLNLPLPEGVMADIRDGRLIVEV